MSAFSPEELERLSKSTLRAKRTSSTQLMKVPSIKNSLTPSASLALVKKPNSALEAFEQSVGGREQLIETLELSNLSKKEEHLLNLLLDPKRKKDSLKEISRDAGLKPVELIDLFRSATFAKAHALALTHMATALPNVVADLVDKSVDSKVECPTCFGAKEVDLGIKCPQCYGKGEIMRFSDLDRQKILLESTGVTKKGEKGINVNVNQQVGIVNPGSFFSSFVKGTDADAYAIDADIVKDEDGQ